MSFNNIIIHYLVGIRDLLGYQQIDYIIWTLEIEVKFYLFMSIFYIFIRKHTKISLVVVVALSILLTAYSVNKSNIALPTDLSEQFAFIALMLIGTYCYLYQKKVNIRLIDIVQLFITIIALFFAFTYMMFNNLWFTNTPTYVYFAYVFGVLMFLIFYFVQPKRNVVLSWFADISYPLYLFHPILGYSIECYLYAYFKMNIYFSIIIAVATVILLAYIVHHLIELPLMRFSKKLTR